MFRRCLVSLVALGSTFIHGCGPAPNLAPPAARVTGTIHLDAKPVAAGELHFGVEGAPPRVVAIKDGTFAGEAPVGENKVELHIFQESSSSEKYGGTRSRANVAPEKFWGPNTVLKAKVSPQPPNEFKFQLTSK